MFGVRVVSCRDVYFPGQIGPMYITHEIFLCNAKKKMVAAVFQSPTFS